MILRRRLLVWGSDQPEHDRTSSLRAQWDILVACDVDQLRGVHEEQPLDVVVFPADPVDRDSLKALEDIVGTLSPDPPLIFSYSEQSPVWVPLVCGFAGADLHYSGLPSLGEAIAVIEAHICQQARVPLEVPAI